MKLCKANTRLLSDPVSSPLAPHIEWRLSIYPDGDKDSYRDYSSVYLIYLNKKIAEGGEEVEEGVTANYQLYAPVPTSTSALFSAERSSERRRTFSARKRHPTVG
jgi:hypothetical protein